MINAGERDIKKVGRGGTEMVKGRKRKIGRETAGKCCFPAAML